VLSLFDVVLAFNYSLFVGILLLRSGKHINLTYYFILGATVTREMAWLATVVTASSFRSIVLFLRFLWVTWLGIDVAQVHSLRSIRAVDARIL
jgi:hypothetical protein